LAHHPRQLYRRTAICQTIDARHDVDVACRRGFEHPQQLVPVGLRSTCLFAIDFGASLGAELIELGVERLAIGADAGGS